MDLSQKVWFFYIKNKTKQKLNHFPQQQRGVALSRSAMHPSNTSFRQYAGTVKCHNVCKRHSFLDTGFKQTEHTIFLHVISMRKI